MKTLLKNAAVLTMRSSEIRYRTDILLENGEIAKIGRDLPCDASMDIIDCTGKYVMPGLFDAHTHMDSAAMAKMFIAAGVTSIRNMSGCQGLLDYDRKRELGEVISPRIYMSSPIYDGADTDHKPELHRFLANEDDALAAIQDTAEHGYLWIKTYPSIEPTLYKFLLTEADKAGFKVCGHMSYFVNKKELRDWGYHCCEHSSSMSSEKDDNIYMAKSGMWLCPTQIVCETLPDYVWNGKKFTDLAHYDDMPLPMKKLWDEQQVEIDADYKGKNLRPDINKVIARGRAFFENSDRYMAGSDCPYPGVTPGFALHDELERLVALYGCTPYEALKAATVNVALFIGIEEHKGMIKEGMDADIVILNGNPLANISNVRDTHAVIQNGHVFDRAALDSLLAEVRSMETEEAMGMIDQH